MARRFRNAKRTRRLSRSQRSTRHYRQFIGLELLERRLQLSAAEPTIELFNTSSAFFVENLGQWEDESVRYLFPGSTPLRNAQGANLMSSSGRPSLKAAGHLSAA